MRTGQGQDGDEIARLHAIFRDLAEPRREFETARPLETQWPNLRMLMRRLGTPGELLPSSELVTGTEDLTSRYRAICSVLVEWAASTNKLAALGYLVQEFRAADRADLPWLMTPMQLVPNSGAIGVESSEEYERIVSTLCVDAGETPRSIALCGVAGIGKSALAARVARDPRVQRRFPCGSLWIQLGPECHRLERVQHLVALTTGQWKSPTDVRGAERLIGEMLWQRGCLLVVDDVCSRLDCRPFMADGVEAARLLTTRDARHVPRGVELIQISTPQQRDVAGAIKRAITQLSKDERERFAGLAVLREGVAIPVEVLAAWWGRGAPGRAAVKDARRFCARLQELSLLSFADGDKSDVQLTRVVHEHLRAGAGSNLAAMHGAFLDALDVGDWVAATKKYPYLSRSLAWHLSESGRRKELDALLMNIEWAIERVNRREGVLLLGDYAARFERDPAGAPQELVWLGEALRLSAHDWLERPQSLLPCLEARLWSLPGAKELLEAIDASQPRPRLCVRWSGVAPPRDAPMRLLEGHVDRLNCLAVSSDGTRIVSASRDGTIRVWNPGVRGEERVIEGSAGDICSISLTPDGLRAVSCSRDGTIRLWDLAGGNEIACVAVVDGQVNGVVAKADGERVVGGMEDGTIGVWNLRTHTRESVLGAKERAWPIHCLALTPDGERAVVGGASQRLCVWNLRTGHEEKVLEGHRGWVDGLAISPDGEWVVSGSDDETVAVWSVRSACAPLRVHRHQGPVRCVAVSPDGRKLVSGSFDGSIRIFDLLAGDELERMDGCGGWAEHIAFMPDGEHVVCGWSDGTIRIWRWAPTTPRLAGRLVTHASRVTALAMTPDGASIVSGSSDSTIAIGNARTGELERLLVGHTKYVRSMVVSDDGDRVWASSSDGTIRCWGVRTGIEQAGLSQHPVCVGSIALVPGGELLVSGSSDSWVRVINLASGVEVGRWYVEMDWVHSVAVTPDGVRIVRASFNPDVLIWNRITGQAEGSLRGHEAGVEVVAVTHDGTRVVSGSWDGTTRVWDLATRRELQRYTQQPGEVNDLALTPDGERVVIAGSDRTLVVWDMTRGEQCCEPLPVEQEVERVVCAPQAGTLTVIVGDRAGLLHCYEWRE